MAINEYGFDDGMEEQSTETVIPRDTPEPSLARAALVSQWCEKVVEAKDHWEEKAFRRIREDVEFVFGKQWPNEEPYEDDSKYVANVTLRHVQQRVAALYAKNPKAVARVRQRMDYQIWDGNMQSLMMATRAAIAGDPLTGMPNPQAQAVVMDFMQAADQQKQMRKIAQTLELLYDYNIDEQIPPFKVAMKQAVRRALVAGVAYIKLGYQRILQPKPEVAAQIADLTQRLSLIERLAADLADKEIDDTQAEAEQLRLTIQDLQGQLDQVVREGLLFDYPSATSIIPDKNTKSLRNFVGASWVAQEYLLTPEKVQEVYGIDVGKSFHAYRTAHERLPLTEGDAETQDDGLACVWEIYNQPDQLVYVVCDGYPDFLQEPAAPDVWIERFWPWFTLIFNDTGSETDIYPPSDVRLISHQQREINRARQGLREHRVANRPKMATAAGALDDEDKSKLQSHPPNAVLELNGLAPGGKIEDLLQPVKMPGIDPNLYETNGAFEDILRTVGAQEANLGGTAGATATESSIAEASRASAQQSNIDDFDDLLTEMARAAGQILLAETSPETVQMVVGKGAIWPQLSRADIAKEIFLEIEAGSAGRPNQAQEVANLERLMPVLIQIPGLNPEFLAREILRRLDDRLNLDEAFAAGMPSIIAMNAMKGLQQAGVSPPGQEPGQQGAKGGANAPQPPGRQGPAPQPPGPPMTAGPPGPPSAMP
jgi:hypothetical protein